jgi:tRNA pseudouridine13 synthase
MTIKQSPADFLVEEVLADALARQVHDRPGALALYRLTKEGLTTPGAVAAVAKRLGVRPADIAYAGLKDRHARTVQHVTVRLASPHSAGGAEAAAGPGWQIRRLGWVDEPLSAAAIQVNRFRITVRGLTREACEKVDAAARLLAPAARSSHPALPAGARKTGEPASLLFVNYFGDQRFGSARHGQGFLARHLVRGEFEEALRLAIAVWARKDGRRQKQFKRAVAEGWGNWRDLADRLPRCPDRRAVEHLAAWPDDYRGAFAALPYAFQELAVHAYQSHLWNATARRLAAERCGKIALAAPTPFGDMLFPAASSIPAELTDLELPVLGRDSQLAEPWKAAAEAVLREECITTQMLRIPGLRRPHFGQVPRRLLAEATHFSLSPPEPESVPETGAARTRGSQSADRFCRTVAFDLPRGSYATVVLRALGQ